MGGFANLEPYCTQMRTQVIRNTGIPVSVGVAPSKTLAKLSNRMAKNFKGVCVLDTSEKIARAVKDFLVEDIWGIGRQYAKKLQSFGITTAHDLRSQPLEWVQEKLTIQRVRVWYELHGKSCIQLASMTDRKQGIRSSRSFRKLTDNYSFLEEAAVAYCARVAEKLRKDKSCATLLSIRVLTNIHRPDTAQYTNTTVMKLPHPTSNILELAKHAVRGLNMIFKPGYLYLKVEVYATGLIPEQEVQLNLFSNYEGTKKNEVSKLMDKLNGHYGKGTVILAAEGFEKKWSMRRNFLSPAYTTEWEGILKVR